MAQAMLFRLERRLRPQRTSPFSFDVASIRIPDSAVCLAASELLASVSEPWLVNHCLRTFLWAAILGKSERCVYDEELLYVSSALHDLGLTDAGAALSTAPADCFAVDGAFAAEMFLSRQGVIDARTAIIAEAIALHLNVRVPLADGVEAHLLHAGAGFDVIGARYGAVAEGTRNAVVQLHPRLDMKSCLVPLMKRQSNARPSSRAAFLCGHGLISMIRHSPFAEP